MTEKKIYCHGEAAEFPSHEFYRDKEGALIHKVGKAHYAATGDPPEIIVPEQEITEEVSKEKGEKPNE